MSKFVPGYLLPVILILITVSCSNTEDKKLELQKRSFAENVGERFELPNIIDSTGKKTDLNFSSSEYTIIDFWNNSCPPCIKEMKQFSELLKGKDDMISIISISVNQFWLWKPTIAQHTGPFSFINNTTPNWTHLVLQSNQDPKLQNEFSIDRIEEIGKKYNVTSFPAYFVLDRKGIIQSRPESAVEFIKLLN